MYKRYLVTIALIILPASIPFGLNELFLERLGEYLPLSEIVHIQQTNPTLCLYGSQVHSDFFHYKLEGYRQIQPRIAAIGSSRVMQFRENMFTDSFYNLGGTLASVEYTRHAVSLMLQAHKPKVVIVGLDFWWFLRESGEPVVMDTPPPEKARRHLGSIVLPFKWLRDGRLPTGKYVNFLLHSWPKTHDCAIGFRALLEGSGFGPDGSHYYSNAFQPGTKISSSERFQGAKDWIISGGNVYKHTQTIMTDQVERFLEILRTLQEKGVTVVIVVPPIPPEMKKEIQRHPAEFAYLDELFALFRNIGIAFYNFHDPATLDLNDCHFLDEAHGNPSVYARMLAFIAAHPQKEGDIRSFLNMPVIRAWSSEGGKGAQGETCDEIENPWLKAYRNGPPRLPREPLKNIPSA